jgi:hypothetical protein
VSIKESFQWLLLLATIRATKYWDVFKKCSVFHAVDVILAICGYKNELFVSLNLTIKHDRTQKEKSLPYPKVAV